MESWWVRYGGNVLWSPVLTLTAIGILFVYSASSVFALQRYGNEFYFAQRQALFLIPALCAAFVGMRVPLEKIFRFIRPLYIFFVCLTLATQIPGLGRKVGGASRWLSLGPFPMQPSEFLKIFTIIFMVRLMTNPFYKGSWKIDLPLLCLSPLAILAQKDLGTTLVTVVGCLGVLFISNIPKRYFLSLFGLLGFGFILAVLFEPYRIARLTSFLNPFADPLGSGFQVIQSFVAVANGGLLGRGLGESQQKLFFLPEAHTDFILAVLAEEVGFLGVAAVAILYCVLYSALIHLAKNGITASHRLLAAGFFCLFVVATLVNMGVVSGALPTKGLPLPFVSNGGSSLIANYFAMGLMAQITALLYQDRRQKNQEVKHVST